MRQVQASALFVALCGLGAAACDSTSQPQATHAPSALYTSGDIFYHATGAQDAKKINLALQHLVPGSLQTDPNGDPIFVPAPGYSININVQEGTVQVIWQATATNMYPPSWKDLPVCYPDLDGNCVCPSDPAYQGLCFFEDPPPPDGPSLPPSAPEDIQTGMTNFLQASEMLPYDLNGLCFGTSGSTQFPWGYPISPDSSQCQTFLRGMAQLVDPQRFELRMDPMVRAQGDPCAPGSSDPWYPTNTFIDAAYRFTGSTSNAGLEQLNIFLPKVSPPLNTVVAAETLVPYGTWQEPNSSQKSSYINHVSSNTGVSASLLTDDNRRFLVRRGDICPGKPCSFGTVFPISFISAAETGPYYEPAPGYDDPYFAASGDLIFSATTRYPACGTQLGNPPTGPASVPLTGSSVSALREGPTTRGWRADAPAFKFQPARSSESKAPAPAPVPDQAPGGNQSTVVHCTGGDLASLLLAPGAPGRWCTAGPPQVVPVCFTKGPDHMVMGAFPVAPNALCSTNQWQTILAQNQVATFNIAAQRARVAALWANANAAITQPFVRANPTWANNVGTDSIQWALRVVPAGFNLNNLPPDLPANTAQPASPPFGIYDGVNAPMGISWIRGAPFDLNAAANTTPLTTYTPPAPPTGADGRVRNVITGTFPAGFTQSRLLNMPSDMGYFVATLNQTVAVSNEAGPYVGNPAPDVVNAVRALAGSRAREIMIDNLLNLGGHRTGFLPQTSWQYLPPQDSGGCASGISKATLQAFCAQNGNATSVINDWWNGYGSDRDPDARAARAQCSTAFITYLNGNGAAACYTVVNAQAFTHIAYGGGDNTTRYAFVQDKNNLGAGLLTINGAFSSLGPAAGPAFLNTVVNTIAGSIGADPGALFHTIPTQNWGDTLFMRSKYNPLAATYTFPNVFCTNWWNGSGVVAPWLYTATNGAVFPGPNPRPCTMDANGNDNMQANQPGSAWKGFDNIHAKMNNEQARAMWTPTSLYDLDDNVTRISNALGFFVFPNPRGEASQFTTNGGTADLNDTVYPRGNSPFPQQARIVSFFKAGFGWVYNESRYAYWWDNARLLHWHENFFGANYTTDPGLQEIKYTNGARATRAFNMVASPQGGGTTITGKTTSAGIFLTPDPEGNYIIDPAVSTFTSTVGP